MVYKKIMEAVSSYSSKINKINFYDEIETFYISLLEDHIQLSRVIYIQSNKNKLIFFLRTVIFPEFQRSILKMTFF